jgi:hypothetical protein
MRGISATGIILIAISAASTAYAAIPCQESAGREQRGVYWSWREIEGKRCWFVREGVAMPPKSMFTWAKEEPEKEEVTSAPEKTKSEPSIRVRMLRVKPINPNELSDLRPNWVGDLPEN